jgi:hypothetical protein
VRAASRHAEAEVVAGQEGGPLEIREFEAQSVCYLVCTRLGIENPSAEYLAAYVRNYQTTPPISLDGIMKSSWLIEQMGRERLKLRADSQPAIAPSGASI